MQHKTILIVEDDSNHELLIRKALERHKIANRIVVARDGAEALDYLLAEDIPQGQEGRPLPELVLLDLKLPKVSGLDVLRQIRSHTRTSHLPVVVLTSSAEERDITASYDLGVNSYIQKPVDFERFLAAVQQLGLYWLVLNTPPSH